jgi:anti-sigma factor RsiW
MTIPVTTDDARPDPTEGSPSLRCVELVELVTDYFEGALPPDTRARVEVHLSQCDPCVTYIQQMRQVVEAAGRLTPEAVPDEAVDRLLSVFREAGSR